jgi:Flp pilus assembly protein TadG
MPEPQKRRLAALTVRFRRSQRGNAAIIFALALLPILAAVGCAIDYSEKTRIQAKMQAAADAAAVASVSFNSAGFKAAANMTANGPVPAGAAEANGIFNGNVANFSKLYVGLSESSTVTKTGNTLTSVVNFSAQVPVTFMKVLGWQTMTIGGQSKAANAMPLYLDFYVTLDVSSSMGLPSTQQEATRLAKLNPDNYVDYPTGCTLACHFSDQGTVCKNPTSPPLPLQNQSGYPVNGRCLGYAISRVSQPGYKSLLTVDSSGQYPYVDPSQPSRHLVLPSSIVSGLPNSIYQALTPVTNCPTAGTEACIQLRLDAVGAAVNALFSAFPQFENVPNQFRIGLYPYIKSVETNYAPLTSNISGSPKSPGTINYAAANLAQLLDTGENANLGSGGTDQDAALTTMNGLIPNGGDGSSSNNPLPFVFIITDGAVTPQAKSVPGNSWSGSNHDTVISSPDSNCEALKNRNITVAILYVPFQPIPKPNPAFAHDEDDYANNNIPSIQGSLQSCATSGYFYTANSPQDITNMLNAMFQKAVIDAHARVTN